MHQVCIRMSPRQFLELSITWHCSIIQSSAQLCNPWCAAVWNPHHLNSATHNPARSRRVLHRLSLSPASLISFHRVLSPSRIVGTLITTSCDVSLVASRFFFPLVTFSFFSSLFPSLFWRISKSFWFICEQMLASSKPARERIWADTRLWFKRRGRESLERKVIYFASVATVFSCDSTLAACWKAVSILISVKNKTNVLLMPSRWSFESS